MICVFNNVHVSAELPILFLAPNIVILKKMAKKWFYVHVTFWLLAEKLYFCPKKIL